MKYKNVLLQNDRNYKEEYIMCREKHLNKLRHHYSWIGNGDSDEWVTFPIDAEVVVVRYSRYGNDWTEMSIVKIQNGKNENLFESETLHDYCEFEDVIKDLEKRKFFRVEDRHYD